jgi:hypothetical protein
MHHTAFQRGRPGAPAPAAVLLLAICLLAVGAQAANASPALAITEPGRYQLDHDLSVDGIGVLITSSDVVFDGMGHSIEGTGGDGTGIYATGLANATPAGPITNVTVRNVTVRTCGAGVSIGRVNGSVVEDVVAEQNGIGFGYGYAEMGGAEQAVLRDSVARDSTGTGIVLDYPSDGVTIERCTITGNANGLASDLSGRLAANYLVDSEVSENAGFGISLRESGLTIRGCTIHGNGANGIQLEHAGATIEANRIEGNAGTGVQSTDRGGSNISSNWIVGNGQGVAVGGDWPSQVWNNVLNNTDNGFFGAAEVGQLNVTRTAGPNIVGGPYLGGNFWAFPNGTGFSETHPDNDGDGFCDEPYVVNPEEGVTDHLPLARPNPPPIGGDTGYFLVSTTPPGAGIYLEDISGTRTLQGTTSAGPLNVTVYLTGTPIRKVVATLPGYRDAVHTVTQYPPKGGTLPVALTLAPTSGGTPYRPHPVPGRVEAEDYDLGGEGVAYHDTTPGNAGGAYRSDDVDIEKMAGLATPNVGWIRDGEFLTYTVNVTQDGLYLVSLRVATPNSGRSVDVSADGRQPAITYRLPNTGSFATYATATLGSTPCPNSWVTVTQTPTPMATGIENQRIPLQLSAGTHTIKLAFHGDGQNLDWFELAPFDPSTPGGPTPDTPLAIPGTIQAEDYDLGGEGVAYHDTTTGNSGGAYRQDNVDIETAGGVTNVGWIRNGEWLTYTATVQSAGAYTMSARVASPNSGRTIAVLVDGTSAGTIAVPNTGSFRTFTTVQVPVTLTAGTHTLRLAFQGDGQNLDWIAFVPPTPTPGTAVTTPTPTPVAGGASFTAAPVTAPKGSAVKFTVTPASGKRISAAWWSFDATAHLTTWNSRNVNPTFYYPRTGTFTPLVKLTYADGSTETVQRANYVRAT